MNPKSEIQRRQNSDAMLDCQYAARVYFNRAEYVGYCAFIVSVFSALCTFLPDTFSAIYIVIPILIDLIACAIQFYSTSIQKKAALLRNYFDAVVLGIRESNYTLEDVRYIREIVIHTINKDPESHQTQIRNTGVDSPPGVRNWYNLSFDENNTNAVFECQKQNYRWTDKLARKRLLISCGAIVAIIIICISSVCLFHLSPTKWIPCFFALIWNQLSNGINAYRHYRIMHEICTIVKMPDIENSPLQIEHLQNKIEKLREIPILEINAIHNRYNKKWEDLYIQIIRK